MRLSKLPKLNPSAIGKCAMVFVPPLSVGKRRGVLITPLRNLQISGAFIAAFTSEKQWMTIKKFIPQLAIGTKFFHSAFFNPCMM
jgi:hypothetical protein